jgi:hypothetical protein
MLSLTASTTDSEAWFSSINNWVEKPLDTLHP